MPYDFEESNEKLNKEIIEEKEHKTEENLLKIDEPFTHLSNKVPFVLSIIFSILCFVFTFNFPNLANNYVRVGLGIYLAYPTFCIIAQILFTKKIKYKLYNGDFYVGHTLLKADDIKNIAITEYTPYYFKNDWFKVPAMNLVGYKDFMITITPRRKKASQIYLFLYNKKSVKQLITFLEQNNIPFGHVEKEPRRLFF